MTREQLIAIMRTELRRQFDAKELGWYAEGDDYVAVDGNPDLGLIADAILIALEAEKK